MNVVHHSPAEAAAAEAQERVYGCLDTGQSFRLEAGAGAGKTYSLVDSLKRLIANRGNELMQSGRKIACITFTEVARDEIAKEIERHPAILVETIHAFSWGVIAQFQNDLRAILESLDDRAEKIREGGGVDGKRVEYKLGFFGVDKDKVSLAHDDIPLFMARLLDNPKFRDVLKRLFPIIFIDEYQDTDRHFMAAISKHFFAAGGGPLVGLFGDHWQTIYRGDFDLAEFPIEGINKGSNFRSAPAIVNVLNQLRQELPQEVSDPEAKGEARFFFVDSYKGERTNTAHSKNDLPPEPSRQFMMTLLGRLESEGWDLSPLKTKVLMLTHSALAAEQGYPSIARIFNRSEAFAKKEDPAIEFFAETLEPMCRAYNDRKYGEMFRLLGNAPAIKSHSDKIEWQNNMAAINHFREHETIGSVLDHLKASRRPRLPDKLMRREEELARTEFEQGYEEPASLTRHRQLRDVPYCEVIELVKFVDGNTPFATQHSVKGAEFENVLVVLGGGWNHYNWPQLLELLGTSKINDKNAKGYFRARNLFYVSISRPKKRLAVLATQAMSSEALATATRLFGSENVHSL